MNNFIIKTFPTETGKLYFCRCPNGKDDLNKIAELKINCIFNLAKEWESIIEIEETVCDTVIAGGIEDYSIPEDMNVFYAQIEYVSELLKQGKNVLVHCWGGRGRTGLALCCINLVLTNESVEATLIKTKKITNGGPEVKSQEEFVKRFKEFSSS